MTGYDKTTFNFLVFYYDLSCFGPDILNNLYCSFASFDGLLRILGGKAVYFILIINCWPGYSGVCEHMQESKEIAFLWYFGW